MLALNLFSKDLVDLYRFGGIEEVQKEIENSLKSIDYWKNYLENKNVEYGYYETKQYILVAKKNQLEINLFQKVGNDYNQIFKKNIIVGGGLGDKLSQGDMKTPIGVYELVEKKTQVDQFYGPFALVTSYPNVYDQSLNKNGSGIWIHGMPYNTGRENFTKGCIALDNIELENLEKKLELKKTILITTETELKKPTKDELASVLSTIFKWKDAWKNSNVEEYLSYYSTDFKKADRSTFEQFAQYKKLIFSKNEKKTINLSNIDISPYPNSLGKNMFRISMDEDYTSPSVKFVGNKELFVELINGQVKILAED